MSPGRTAVPPLSSFESQLVEKPKPTGAKGGQDWVMNSTHILTGKLNKPKEGSLVMMFALKTGQRPLNVCSMLTREVLLASASALPVVCCFLSQAWVMVGDGSDSKESSEVCGGRLRATSRVECFIFVV